MDSDKIGKTNEAKFDPRPPKEVIQEKAEAEKDAEDEQLGISTD